MPVLPCSYVYTAEDVQKMVERKRQQGGAKINSTAEEARLRRLLEHATESVGRARGEEEQAMHQEEVDG